MRAIAGHAPFVGDYAQIAQRHALDAPPPILTTPLSAELESVVNRALEKDPGARFPSMEAFRIALLASLPSVS